MANFEFYLNRQGVKGRKGDQGEQGFSPIITVKTQTANEYVLNVQNEDGSFDTPNLRGNAIENNGGNYIRYNPVTEEMYTGYADYASYGQSGQVQFATYEQLEIGGAEELGVTSKDVYDFVMANKTESSFDFDQLALSLVEGDNITLDVDTESETITINSSATGGIELTDLSIDSGSSNYLAYDNTTGKFSAKVDTTVTQDSNELITSGAVYSKLSNLVTTNTTQTITGRKLFWYEFARRGLIIPSQLTSTGINLVHIPIQFNNNDANLTQTASIGFNYGMYAQDYKLVVSSNYELSFTFTPYGESSKTINAKDIITKNDIASSVDSSSTNDKPVGAKLFYDTVGDIETLLNNINSGNGS